MLTYRELPQLSPEQCRRRLEEAKRALGEAVLNRLLGFALFSLGANRRAVAELVQLPQPTLQSVTERVLRDGLPALEDRRSKSSTLLPRATPKSPPLRLRIEQNTLVVQVNEHQELVIPRQNVVQCRTVLLSMLECGLLGAGEVASGLGISTERVRQLRTRLHEGDAKELIDQRKGQQQDYRVSQEVKAEIIQQYVLNLQTDGRTSSDALRNDLLERCAIALSARTIRLHVNNLGLRRIRDSLPQLLAQVKKTSPS
jgi:hypothetical protein